jgi:hypothetical protein
MFMIMFVLDDATKLDMLLESWYDLGIRGVTIIESTGFHRRQVQRSKLHLTFLIEPISVGSEEGNLTLFTVVDDEVMTQKCLNETQAVVGNLEGPNTGIFLGWPLSVVKGIHKNIPKGSQE